MLDPGDREELRSPIWTDLAIGFLKGRFGSESVAPDISVLTPLLLPPYTSALFQLPSL
jgi:hypothetical protein